MAGPLKSPLFFMLFAFALSLHADENIEDFEALLGDVSEIATKSSLNVDYMPSVVTVIDAEEFRDAGLRNLAEALEMLPGVQIQISPMGYTMTTVRGLKNPNAYLSDKIKIMVDGVAINNEVSGSSHFYMDFPLQLVEKIEVLRGPGSTMYGAGSFYGTINIITKMGKGNTTDRLMLGAGSYEYLTGGANVHTKAGSWDLFFDGYYQRNDKRLFSQQTGPWGSLNVEGYSDESFRDYSVGFKAVNGGWELLTRFKRNVSGNYYSFEGKFNPIPERDGEHGTAYLLSQIAYAHTLDGVNLKVKAGYSHRENSVDANIYSVAQTSGKFADVGIDMQEGFLYSESVFEDNYEAEAIAELPEYYGNAVLAGAGVRYAEVTHDDFYSSVENAILLNKDAILAHPDYDSFRYNAAREPAFWSNPTRSLLKDDADRTIAYAYLQDLIALSDSVDVILGLRIDDYSDFGTQWSKRAGLVYRATDRLIFKGLYGSAFRAPTFIEAYQNGHINFRAGDPDIKPEETDTYEFVTIFKPTDRNKFQLNLFYSRLYNVIDLEEYPDTDAGYQNFHNRSSKGAELEYFYNDHWHHTLYLNASYINADYVIPPEAGETPVKQSMPDISKVMLKGMYIYRPTKTVSFAGTWRYYSETTPTELNWVKEDGIDSTVDAVHIFDTTMTYRFTPMSIARFTVKNLFDADVRNPSYYYLSDGGVQRDGMHFSAEFEQRF